jgi:hypothetical protein
LKPAHFLFSQIVLFLKQLRDGASKPKREKMLDNQESLSRAAVAKKI